MTSPANRPRLVATDLDGTLVRRDGSVSGYTREVLARLDDLGVPVIFVTGRPLRWTSEVFEHVGSHGLAVVSNGALVWDVARQRPQLERHLDPGVARETVWRLREAIPGLHFATETVEGWCHEAGYHTHRADAGALDEARRIAPVEELLDEPLLKLLAVDPDADADELLGRARAALGDEVGGVNVTHSSFPLLEISAAEVTKASTLALLAAERGIGPEEVIAFGDMPNDLPMLTWAGTAYAMADAHPDVRDCADAVAPPAEDDGVARVLAGVFDL